MMMQENDTKQVITYGHEMYMKGLAVGVVSTVSLYISYKLLKEYWTHEISKKSSEKHSF